MSGHLAERSRKAYVALGVVLVVVGVLATATSIAVYRGTFSAAIPVKLYSARAGLMLEPGSDVKMREVVVGRVTEVKLVDGQAEISMDIDKNRANSIAANVSAAIDTTTLFGRKFVTLAQPESPSGEMISAGTVLSTGQVATEVNDLLESLVTVLRTLEPEKVNGSLNALATSLHGRGDQLGDTLVEINTYLSSFNDNLPTLQRDVVQGAQTTDILAAATPDVMATVDHASTTASTITERQDQLNAFILSFTGFGNSGRSFFVASGTPLTESLSSLAPTTELLAERAPTLSCLVESLAQTNTYLERTVGGSDQPGLNILGTLLMGDPPYTNPANLPVVEADGPVACYDSTQPQGHTDFNDGSAAYRPARTPMDLIGNPFAQFFLGGLR
ncbi:MCE family protein [Rhodococcus opacus]|uniref:MCE family protein n=1 Tax=Rhodococcus opacus TaxID=37919 RepID=UPI000EA98B56|nr:MCE family protein [Rhodococcus opacus]QZS52619.1 MCE family protein [Rhodococcus opacus]RKM64839.1 mammalian cell entry protein [Rhodococcus opacus]